MSKRLPLSILEPSWHDAQRVNQDDLQVEQTHVDSLAASIIGNHFGSGVLLSKVNQATIFDSDVLDSTQVAILAAGNFDGTGLNSTLQPSDTVLGNQLEIELSNSSVFGRLSVKVLIIGVDFSGAIQYDRFTFHRNEKQVSSKHYARILTIFFNDFKGNNNCSRNNGGRIVIKEVSSLQLSRQSLVVSQDFQPNIFFRDFKTTSSLPNNLRLALQAGIGSEFSFDALKITTTVKINRSLEANDVTTQIGQKFLATTNNIQKITLLLGVARDELAAIENRYDWAGDLVMSLYPLQKTVDCPTDIIPDLAIDFDPESVPLAQLSFNQQTLKSAGTVLNDVLQPVDFVLSSTKVGSATNPIIIPGEFYAVTIRRSGAATNGIVFTGVGTDLLNNSRLTMFSSGVWVDVPEEDLWFQIWSDSAKVSDGQFYDSGNGADLNKTIIDTDTGATIDYQFEDKSFSNSGANILNIGIMQAVETGSSIIQDERTGNPVFSRQQFTPSFSFVNENELSDLKKNSDPLIIGSAKDINPKQNPTLTKVQNKPGLVNGDNFCIVNPDADLLSLNLVGSKLIPNINSGFEYKIFKTTVCTDALGDVLGDGKIDEADIARASQLIGESLLLSSTQVKIQSGLFTALEVLRADVDGDGYVTIADQNQITNYVNRVSNSFTGGSSFTHLCLEVMQMIGRDDGYFSCRDGLVRLDGYLGVNIVSAQLLTTQELIYDGYNVPVTIEITDPSFTTTPFIPITYRIEPLPFWQDYFLIFSSNARKVPASFTFDTGIQQIDCTPSLLTSCKDRADVATVVDPGRNDIYVPDNLVIGNGNILRPDGSSYKVDFEVGTVILELPQIPLQESKIDVFNKFVADHGAGLTTAGFGAMRFSDCSTVSPSAVVNNQVRFGVAIQSIAKNLDGYSILDGYGIVVDENISTSIDSNGILTITAKDLSVDLIFITLITKIEITVYLKKAGFENKTLTITPNLIPGLLSI